MERNSEDKILAGISHLGIVTGWVGLVIALVIYLIRKDQSSFVKRCAKQAMGYQICTLVIMQVLILIFGGSVVLGIISSKLVTMSTLGFLFVKTVNLGLCALGIWGAIKTFLGEYFRYPVIGGFIDQL